MAIPVREEALLWSLAVLDGEKSDIKKSTSPARQGLDRSGLE